MTQLKLKSFYLKTVAVSEIGDLSPNKRKFLNGREPSQMHRHFIRKDVQMKQTAQNRVLNVGSRRLERYATPPDANATLFA